MGNVTDALDELGPAHDENGYVVTQRKYDAMRSALKDARGWLEIAAEYSGHGVGRPEAFREPVAQIDAALQAPSNNEAHLRERGVAE